MAATKPATAWTLTVVLALLVAMTTSFGSAHDPEWIRTVYLLFAPVAVLGAGFLMKGAYMIKEATA